MWQYHQEEDPEQYRERLKLLHNKGFEWAQCLTSPAPDYMQNQLTMVNPCAEKLNNQFYKKIRADATELLQPAIRSLSLLLLGSLHTLQDSSEANKSVNRTLLYNFIVDHALKFFRAEEALMAAMIIIHHQPIILSIPAKSCFAFDIDFNHVGIQNHCFILMDYVVRCLKNYNEETFTSCLEYFEKFLSDNEDNCFSSILKISAIRALLALGKICKAMPLERLVQACKSYCLFYSNDPSYPSDLFRHHACVAEDLAKDLPMDISCEMQPSISGKPLSPTAWQQTMFNTKP